MTPKVVMFDVSVGEPPKQDGQEDDMSADKLDGMIRELSGKTCSIYKYYIIIICFSASLTAVKQEQEYMQVRDRIHRAINESTNSRVVMWSFFEAFILLAMTLGQVYYLKRFFEVRRVV